MESEEDSGWRCCFRDGLVRDGAREETIARGYGTVRRRRLVSIVMLSICGSDWRDRESEHRLGLFKKKG
jgi:hypothetical protein